MLKNFVAVVLVAMLVMAVGCGGSRTAESAESVAPPAKARAKSFGFAQGKPMVKLEVVAVKKPAIYLHQFKKTVIIVRDDVGLGLEPRWGNLDRLLAKVFGELNLDRPRTFEFVWTTNPKQNLLVSFRSRDKKPDDRYVRTTIQAAYLQGRRPQECRDLIQSSFLVALNTIESGNRSYANLRALVEPRLAYAFDVPQAGGTAE